MRRPVFEDQGFTARIFFFIFFWPTVFINLLAVYTRVCLICSSVFLFIWMRSAVDACDILYNLTSIPVIIGLEKDEPDIVNVIYQCSK